jgi:hypothetical protein
MQLTTVSNQFQFNLPTDFLPPGLEAKYEPMLRKNHVVYNSVLDYVNSTILEVVMPGINFDFSTQVKKRKKIRSKAAENIYDAINNEVEIVFRSVDANLNYLIMFDAVVSSRLDLDRPNDPDMFVLVVDTYGDVLMKVTFRSVMLKSLSECRFAYPKNVGQDTSFTMAFTFNYVDVEFLLDQSEIIQDVQVAEVHNAVPYFTRQTNETDDHG